MDYKNYILKIRKNDDLTQAELAHILGVSETTIKYIETGRVKKPSDKSLKSLAKYTKTSPIIVIRDIYFDDSIIEAANKSSAVDMLTKYTTCCILDKWNLIKCELAKNTNNLQTRISHQKYPSKITEIYAVNNFKTEHPYNCDEFLELLFGTIVDYSYLHAEENVKAIAVIFDAKNKKETQLFNNLVKALPTKGKFKVTLILFDKDECKTIKKWIC